MAGKDREYFLERAVKERSMAWGSEDNAVALAHLRFAEEYERRAAALNEAERQDGVMFIGLRTA